MFMRQLKPIWKICIAVYFILACVQSNAQSARTKITINEDWRFIREDVKLANQNDLDDSGWERISLPHTWNDKDVEDEAYGYFRGVGWYRKDLNLDKTWDNRQVFIHFEAANQVAEVFVNGKKVGKHIGGYAAFSYDITDYLKDFEGSRSENVLAVRLDNSHNEDISPLSADFTFFGGIYRDVYLVGTPKAHFDLLNYGSNGIFITTPNVSAERGEVKIRAHVKNEENTRKKLVVLVEIYDSKGKLVLKQTQKVKLQVNSTQEVVLDGLTVVQPLLWSPDTPNLYRISTKLIDPQSNTVLDEVINPLGFRWYEFSADKGFFLNGKALKLMGANRHQDYPGMGNALPDQLHLNDMKLLKDMGANFIRVAHYQHDPTVLEACDKLGLIASVEIPIINTITETPEFEKNSLDMTREMVYRDYNHPSVVMWAYMNEIMLGMRYRNDKEKREPYIRSIVDLAQKIEDLIREEDPYRYTMIPNGGAFNTYKNPGLTEVAMVVGWNLYPGWYGSDFEGFEHFLDRHHKELSHKPVIVSEYGAGADPRIRSFEPKRFDFSLEYQSKYNHYYYKAIMERDFVAGGLIWNFIDFNSEHRIDAVPHINNKGMVDQHRRAKDIYYYYQVMLKDAPQVIIPSKLWTHRTGEESEAGVGICLQSMEVYSNMDQVQLSLNGKVLGTAKPEGGICKFEVPFIHGENLLEALGKSGETIQKDFHRVNFDLVPARLDSQTQPFSQIAVNVGSHCYFFDDKLKQVWHPEKPYTEGSWGYVGGEIYLTSGWKVGTARDITGTTNNPLYQTQRVDLEAFRFDVPDGKYELTLHFAELMSNKEMKKLLYNLGNDTRDEKEVRRCFQVNVNGRTILDQLDLKKSHGEYHSLAKKLEVISKDKEGVVIQFKALEGKVVLNAISLRRVY
jgi:beta-galactosidase